MKIGFLWLYGGGWAVGDLPVAKTWNREQVGRVGRVGSEIYEAGAG